MASAISSTPDVCRVCLSLSTTLSPLGEYTDLYYLLLGKNDDVVDDDSDIETKSYLCCICQDMFKKIQEFQQKIWRAQNIVLRKVKLEKQQCNDTSDPKIYMKTEVVYNDENPTDTRTYFKEEDYDIADDDDVDVDYESEYICDVKKRSNRVRNVTDDIKIEIESINETNDIKNRKHRKESSRKENISLKFLNDTKVEKNVIKINKIKNILKENKVKRDKSNFKKVPVKEYVRGANSFKVVSGRELLKRKYNYFHVERCADKNIVDLIKASRFNKFYRLGKFKCGKCIKVFNDEDLLSKHTQDQHSETAGSFICEYCEVRTQTKKTLQSHIRRHYCQYLCRLCDHKCHFKWQVRSHFLEVHTTLFECRECGLVKCKRRDFFNHVKEMHKKFICDYCGKVCLDRHVIEKHIFYNHTSIYSCKPCDKRFSTFRSYFLHNKLHHVRNISENTYCVECDRQFENQDKMRNHLRDSVRHGTARKKKSATCPECGKLYNCNGNMMNHYRLVHLKVTNYQCAACSRYFLNSYRLKQHVKSIHERIAPPKDKICTYCGRGFSTKVILANHIRTHTGERPHACPHCTAAFAQSYALQTHIKARHKDLV